MKTVEAKGSELFLCGEPDASWQSIAPEEESARFQHAQDLVEDFLLLRAWAVQNRCRKSVRSGINSRGESGHRHAQPPRIRGQLAGIRTDLDVSNVCLRDDDEVYRAVRHRLSVLVLDLVASVAYAAWLVAAVQPGILGVAVDFQASAHRAGEPVRIPEQQR